MPTAGFIAGNVDGLGTAGGRIFPFVSERQSNGPTAKTVDDVDFQPPV